MDTIYALATPPQPAPVAWIRVSGPACAALARSLGLTWENATAAATLDTGPGPLPLRLWMARAPHTYTGQDSLELALPGNPLLVAAVERWLAARGLRPAVAGEFTRRALEAGKLDLSRAEAVHALINAQTDAQRREALGDLRGDFARALSALAEALRALSASYEVAFDFSEDEIETPPFAALAQRLLRISEELTRLGSAPHARPRRAMPQVALFGAPNAGKSSLFNALLGRRRSLVSEVPGTTRDPVSAAARFGDITAELVDLSGVGSADSDCGRFAQRARDAARQADILLLLCAPGQAPELQTELEILSRDDPGVPARCLWVWTKADLTPGSAMLQAPMECLAVSARTGAGLPALARAIEARLAAAGAAPHSTLREGARRAQETLFRAAQGVSQDAPEATAALVRRALRDLDEALLQHAPGEVLDFIFTRFCIGK